MNNFEYQALQNAAASSAMEGLPLTQKDIEMIQDILDGKTTLQDYLDKIKAAYGDSTYLFFISSNTYTMYYRYRDRSLVYTYYFSKAEEMESTTMPTGENISNVQEWVQYRAP